MITLMNLENLIILSIQMVAIAIVILFTGYIWSVFKNEIWYNFRSYPLYKKIAIIMITPPIIFAIGWLTLFILLGPEKCDLIL
jgi:hypothetical protein